MILYTWAPSLASFRVRMALNLKGLVPEYRYVHLRRNGGEQLTEDYARVNPLQAVPVLIDGRHTLTQSMAILEYLEDTHPEPRLLPADPVARARVRAVCEAVNSDIHPLGTPRVMRYLRGQGFPDDRVRAWYPHWMREGLTRLDRMLADSAGRCCFGDAPTFADCFVIPQVYYARLQGVDLSSCNTLDRIWAHWSEHPAVMRALPSAQADWEG